MENYLLCGEIGGAAAPSSHSESNGSVEVHDGDCLLYKGRRKGTVNFVGIWKHSKTKKDVVTNGVCIMHSLDHRNVLKFLEWYETPKHIWVITELATGGSLADILEQDGCIPPPHTNNFVIDIARGLHYLHSRNVLYCDLQPRKILLDNCEALKLSDFMLAQSVEDSDKQVRYDFRSTAKVVFGERSSKDVGELQIGGRRGEVVLSVGDSVPSPFYAAPELFDGAKFSTASDLWSLGVLMYELCTGRQPFHGSNSDELVFSVCHGTADMKLVNSVAKEDEMKVNEAISLLLQKSLKFRSWDELFQRKVFTLQDIL